MKKRKDKMKPDIEVIFEFCNKNAKICNGYRPSHLIKENYLTTGVHHYNSECSTKLDKVSGTITFISPEEYPHTMWLGKRIQMYEGSRCIGYAEVTKILNLLLLKN